MSEYMNEKLYSHQSGTLSLCSCFSYLMHKQVVLKGNTGAATGAIFRALQGGPRSLYLGSRGKLSRFPSDPTIAHVTPPRAQLTSGPRPWAGTVRGSPPSRGAQRARGTPPRSRKGIGPQPAPPRPTPRDTGLRRRTKQTGFRAPCNGCSGVGCSPGAAPQLLRGGCRRPRGPGALGLGAPCRFVPQPRHAGAGYPATRRCAPGSGSGLHKRRPKSRSQGRGWGVPGAGV
ncbi:hypothetical protein EI555_007344 [Monodon monoceros]|uniref:Uncharacterized protein n=1 Tax=Monodon monoceros TaxID=40151 RepID=A0A4U1EL25_MONMO|nr:hypothetical protein EI555_007344 [Monodon monoceros]